MDNDIVKERIKELAGKWESKNDRMSRARLLFVSSIKEVMRYYILDNWGIDVDDFADIEDGKLRISLFNCSDIIMDIQGRFFVPKPLYLDDDPILDKYAQVGTYDFTEALYVSRKMWNIEIPF